RGQSALRVSHQPEGFDVLFPDLADDRGYDVLQVFVVSIRPESRRRVGRGDHEPVLVLVVQDWEIVALPIAVRAEAVQAQNKRDLLARLQVARIVKEVGAAGLHLDDGSWIDDTIGSAVLVRTMQPLGRNARRTGQLQWLLGAGIAGEHRKGYRQDQHQDRIESRLHVSPPGASITLIE